MVPYFQAAGHWQYFKYTIWYILEMRYLGPQEGMQMYLDGHHVFRHMEGTWNAVFSDQLGEQMCIRHGKTRRGLVGKTLSLS